MTQPDRSSPSIAPPIDAEAQSVSRAELAAFFGLQPEHLPPAHSMGLQRLVATYLYARTPGFDITILQQMLDQGSSQKTENKAR